ncbi:MAG: hypothetical protein ACHQDY_04980 [Solirubrobacterales bacterium]
MPGSEEDQTGVGFERLRVAHDRLSEAYVVAYRNARGIGARPIVDAHLRRGTESVRKAYIQARETTFRSQAQREWLDAQIHALGNLRATFEHQWHTGTWIAGITSIFGLPGLLSALMATSFVVATLAILRACMCHLVFAVPLIASLAVLLTFVVGFDAKRKLFLSVPADTDGGIYTLEDNVFAALGETKDRERPLDVVGWALMAMFFLAATIAGESAIDKGLFTNRYFFSMYIYTGILALVAVWSYLSTRSRTPR